MPWWLILAICLIAFMMGFANAGESEQQDTLRD